MKEVGEGNIIYKLQEKCLERERTAMFHLMKTVSELTVEAEMKREKKLREEKAYLHYTQEIGRK